MKTPNTRREFLADVGRGMLVASVGYSVATDLGLSRASVYRLLKRGALRRFKGGVAETSFCDLLREHPEAIPYLTLPRDQKEWLVLNGYSDPSLSVKRPSVRGLLD